MSVSRIKDYGLRLKKEATDDDISGLAAELTYRVFLALFPFVLFLAALGSVLVSVFDIQNPAQQFLDLFGDRLPPDAQSIIRGQVTGVVESRNFGVLSFGILGALWAAMGGAGAVIKATNRVYDLREGRPFYWQKLLALVITLLGVLAVFISVGVIFSTQFFQDDIADRLGFGNAAKVSIQIGAIPAVILAITLFTTLIYRLAPAAKVPLRNCAPGALLFAVSWAIVTAGFGTYVKNFGSYNETYGTLGGVVVLLFWFYLTNLLLLTGAEVNSLTFRAVRETNDAVLPEYRPETQQLVMGGQMLPAAAVTPPVVAVPAPVEPVARGAVIVGIAAFLVAAFTFVKYSLLRAPRSDSAAQPTGR